MRFRMFDVFPLFNFRVSKNAISKVRVLLSESDALKKRLVVATGVCSPDWKAVIAVYKWQDAMNESQIIFCVFVGCTPFLKSAKRFGIVRVLGNPDWYMQNNYLSSFTTTGRIFRVPGLGPKCWMKMVVTIGGCWLFQCLIRSYRM